MHIKCLYQGLYALFVLSMLVFEKIILKESNYLFYPLGYTLFVYHPSQVLVRFHEKLQIVTAADSMTQMVWGGTERRLDFSICTVLFLTVLCFDHRRRNRGGRRGPGYPTFFLGGALIYAFISTILPLHECI